MMTTLIRRAAVLRRSSLLAAAAWACSEPTKPKPVASIGISPPSATIVINGTQQFTATTFDDSHTALTGRTVTWSVSSNVATVSPTGLVTAANLGAATLVAASEGKAAAAIITVVSGVNGVSLAAPDPLTVGTSRSLTASVETLPGVSQSVTWRSSNPAIATVAANGTNTASVTAVSIGTTTITATSVADTTQRASVALSVIPVLEGGVNFVLTDATITQVVQRPDNSVSMVAGNAALVSVYGVANQPGVGASVPVRVRLFKDGQAIFDDTRAASVPIGATTSPTTPIHQILIPGNLIQPGISLLAEVNPAGAGQIAEKVTSDNVYPSSGVPLAITVRTMPVLSIRFVPIFLSANAAQSTVTPSIIEPKYLATLRRIHPVNTVSTSIASTFTIGDDFSGGATSFWTSALAQLDAKRVADGGIAHDYGVVPLPPGTHSVSTGGFGYIPGNGASTGTFTRTAMGMDATVNWTNPLFGQETLAHEMGHNMGRRHAPCGGATNVDPSYPYANATIGVVGWDVYSLANGLTSTPTLKDPSTSTDIMSYCYDWISDYTYQGMIDFLANVAGGAPADEAPTQTLLVSGAITRAGAVLAPEYVIDTRPVVPDGRGPYQLEGFDAAGRRLFQFAFTPTAIDHTGDQTQFTFAIPLDDATRDALARVRVSGPGAALAERVSGIGRAALSARIDAARPASPAFGASVARAAANRLHVRWDAATIPGVMIRDPDTGEVLAFATGGDATIATSKTAVQLSFSDGVQSVTHLVSAR